MHDVLHIGREALMDEVTRYLAAVDGFRALGHEPTWRPEIAGSAPVEPALDTRHPHIEKSAH